eukprot:scaffold78091_cov14-Tisochrysis_lutea.AAC.1
MLGSCKSRVGRTEATLASTAQANESHIGGPQALHRQKVEAMHVTTEGSEWHLDTNRPFMEQSFMWFQQTLEGPKHSCLQL